MYTHMGRPYAYTCDIIIIGPYAYGISHTLMGRPIRVWANIRIWGRTFSAKAYFKVVVISVKIGKP